MIEPQMVEPLFQGARGTHGDSNSKDWASKASMGMYRYHQLSIGLGLPSKIPWLINMNSWPNHTETERKNLSRKLNAIKDYAQGNQRLSQLYLTREITLEQKNLCRDAILQDAFSHLLLFYIISEKFFPKILNKPQPQVH
jgi:hypothetical protein